jgi:hypothetical protein
LKVPSDLEPVGLAEDPDYLSFEGAFPDAGYWITSEHRGGNRRKGFTETGYARLLDAAHQQLGGPVVLVGDNLNAHVSQAMTELIAARDWLTVCHLPPYAPELNPIEPLWSHLKDPWPTWPNATSTSSPPGQGPMPLSLSVHQGSDLHVCLRWSV